jgi:hypothetical protein
MKTMSLITSARDFALHCWPAIALLVVMVLALAGYAAWPRMTATTSTIATGATITSGWSRVCVAGVSYLQFTSGASVEWTPAGKVKACSEGGK